MVDDKLAQEEANRAATYETVKGTAQAEIAGEVALETAKRTPADAAQVQNIAADMRAKAVDEVVETEHEVERGRQAARVSQVVDYVFFVIYGLLVLRLLLELFAARESAGFVQFIKSVTGPFYAPFRGIVASPSTPEGFTLALPIVIALIAYLLLHMAINGFLRMLAHRKTEV